MRLAACEGKALTTRGSSREGQGGAEIFAKLGPEPCEWQI